MASFLSIKIPEFETAKYSYELVYEGTLFEFIENIDLNKSVYNNLIDFVQLHLEEI